MDLQGYKKTGGSKSCKVFIFTYTKGEIKD